MKTNLPLTCLAICCIVPLASRVHAAAAQPAPAPKAGTTPATKAPATSATKAATTVAGADTKQAAIVAGVAKLFDLSKLHTIDVVIAPVDVAKVATRTDERVRCTFTFDGIVLKDVGVRQAGGIYHPYLPIDKKPSLSIKFNEFVKGQDLFGLEKLVIKNFLQDQSLMNEHMTYEVFRRAGLAASLTAYAVVTINGVPSGLYLMREPVNEQFLIRNFGTGNETGNLYEPELNIGDFVNVPNSIELKDEVKEKRSRADIITLAATTSETPSEYFAQAVSPLVDMDRYIRFMAVEALTSDMDGFSYHNNNSYMYAMPKDGRFVFFPHGADEAFWATGTAITRLSGPFHPAWGLFSRKVQSVPELMKKFDYQMALVSGEPIWDQAALLERVAQVGRIFATAEKTGQTAIDLARFETNRKIVEEFIRSNGITRTGDLK